MKEMAEMLMNNTEQKNLFFFHWVQLQMVSKYRTRAFIGVFSSEHSPAAPAPPVPGPGSVPPPGLGSAAASTAKIHKIIGMKIEQLKCRGASSPGS